MVPSERPQRPFLETLSLGGLGLGGFGLGAGGVGVGLDGVTTALELDTALLVGIGAEETAGAAEEDAGAAEEEGTGLADGEDASLPHFPKRGLHPVPQWPSVFPQYPYLQSKLVEAIKITIVV